MLRGQKLDVMAFEVIVVDNGSTVYSVAIMKELVEEFARISVFHEPKLGPDLARIFIVRPAGCWVECNALFVMTSRRLAHQFHAARRLLI
jgi:hypothetical protein